MLFFHCADAAWKTNSKILWAGEQIYLFQDGWVNKFPDTGQCKQNSIVDGQEDVTWVQASFLKDSPCADVIEHLGWRKQTAERGGKHRRNAGGVCGSELRQGSEEAGLQQQ